MKSPKHSVDNSTRRRFLLTTGLLGSGFGAVGGQAVATPAITATTSRQTATSAETYYGRYGGTATTTVEYRTPSSAPEGYEILGTKTYQKETAGLLLEEPATTPPGSSLDSAADESNPFGLRLIVGAEPVGQEFAEAGDVRVQSAHLAHWSPDPFEPAALFQHWSLQVGESDGGSVILSGVYCGLENEYNYVYTANPAFSLRETRQQIVPRSTLEGTIDGSTITFRLQSPFFELDEGVVTAETTQSGIDPSTYRSTTQFACDVTVSQ